MNRILFISFLTLNLACFSQIPREINKDAYVEFNKADKKLNEVYQNILTEYKSDSIFIKKLKNTQRIWISFRDAQLEMKYPNYSKSYHSSSLLMCRAFYLKELTVERTEKLKVWLNGIKEGDICSGSVKIN